MFIYYYYLLLVIVIIIVIIFIYLFIINYYYVGNPLQMRGLVANGDVHTASLPILKRTLLHHQRGVHSSTNGTNTPEFHRELDELNYFAPYCECIYGWMLHTFTNLSLNWRNICCPCCFNRRSHEIITKRLLLLLFFFYIVIYYYLLLHQQ